MKWIFLALCLLVGVAIIFTNRNHEVSVTKASAVGWVWVEPNEQQHFVDQLRELASSEGLRFNPSKQSGPSWPMIGVILVTPKENEITVINATQVDKFSVAIAVFHRDDQWQKYWSDFRAYVSARYRWEDAR